MKITIKNRLLLCFTALILLSVIAQLVFNLLFADGLYTQYKKQYMERAFEEIEEAYDGDIDRLSEVVSEIEETHNIQLIIENESEIIYASYIGFLEEADFPTNEGRERSGENKNRSLDSWLDRQLEQIPEDQEYSENPKASEIVNDTNNDNSLTLCGMFEYEDETVKVTMMLPSASIENTATFFTNAYNIIAAIILIIGISIASRVAKSITKPIENVEKVTYNLANLEFGEYVSEDNNTIEVDNLAKSINQMSRELQGKIEDLNHANEKLQHDVEHQMQLEQMRREFIANVSHEMKTPLAILQFYCENIKNDVDGIDKEYYFNTIIEEIQRMDEMVKSMLDISSIENGLSKMVIEEMNLSNLVNHTITKLQPFFEHVKLIIEVDDDLIVQGDARYLEQAIKNYITNAVSHTAEGNIIRVALKQDGEFAKFTVYNEGKPIVANDIDRIWESFYKSDKSRVREINTNVGLGLYIVKSIIEIHNGTYGVSNIEEGVEFLFQLPII